MGPAIALCDRVSDYRPLTKELTFTSRFWGSDFLAFEMCPKTTIP